MYQVLLAYALIHSDGPIPDLTPADCSALQAVCLQEELIDEEDYIKFTVDNYRMNLETVRMYRRHLQSAPSLVDEGKWKHHDWRHLSDALSFQRQYAERLRNMPCWNRETRDAMLLELRRRENCYNTLTDLLQWRTVYSRRCCLKLLRDYLTEEEYRNGILPEAVPTEWFVRID